MEREETDELVLVLAENAAAATPLGRAKRATTVVAAPSIVLLG